MVNYVIIITFTTFSPGCQGCYNDCDLLYAVLDPLCYCGTDGDDVKSFQHGSDSTSLRNPRDVC